jgi:hypothetical protein
MPNHRVAGERRCGSSRRELVVPISARAGSDTEGYKRALGIREGSRPRPTRFNPRSPFQAALHYLPPPRC